METGIQTDFEVEPRELVEKDERQRVYTAWVDGLPWLDVVYAEEILEGDETSEDGDYDSEEWEEVKEGEGEGEVEGRRERE